MKNILISLLVLFGTTFSAVAQDKLVLRNGRTIEVNIQRSLEDRVEYTYPGESTVYERPKSAISEIRYENGRKETLDEKLRQVEDASQSRQRTSQASTRDNSQTVTRSNSQTNADGVPWQDVKTTFTTEDVNSLKRLQRVTATSTVSYKDAILKLKKKAAEIGGTTVLVMDEADNNGGKTIEVVGIAYRDESVEVAPSRPAVAPVERSSAPTSAQNSSNTRRRRILQQMEGYNNDSNLDLSEPRQQTSARNSQKELAYEEESNASDAVYLLNGRVIRGTIEEFEPDDFVSIRTENGKVVEYSMDDVRRVQRGNVGAAKSSGRQTASRQTNARASDDESAYEYANRNNRSQNSRPSRTSYKEENYYEGGVTGYKGTFDLGYTLPMGIGEQGRIEVHTSHGYQLNEYLFVGVGAGLHVYSARDANLKYSKIGAADNYPRYKEDNKTPAKVNGNYTTITPDSATTWMHAIDSSYMIVPVFLDLRGYYPVTDKLSPFVMLRLGYSFNLTDGFGVMGLYMNPAVGIKYSMSPKLGITLSVGYSTQSYGGVPGKNRDGGYGFYYVKEDKQIYEAKNAGGVTLRLGVEF